MDTCLLAATSKLGEVASQLSTALIHETKERTDGIEALTSQLQIVSTQSSNSSTSGQDQVSRLAALEEQVSGLSARQEGLVIRAQQAAAAAAEDKSGNKLVELEQRLVKMEASDEPPVNSVECSSCGNHLSRESFSGNQLKKPDKTKRRCKLCVDQSSEGSREGTAAEDASVRRLAALEEHVSSLAAKQEGLVIRAQQAAAAAAEDESGSKLMELEDTLPEALEESVNRVAALEKQVSSVVTAQELLAVQAQQAAAQEALQEVSEASGSITRAQQAASAALAEVKAALSMQGNSESKLEEIEARLTKIEASEALDTGSSRVSMGTSDIVRIAELEERVGGLAALEDKVSSIVTEQESLSGKLDSIDVYQSECLEVHTSAAAAWAESKAAADEQMDSGHSLTHSHSLTHLLV